MNNLLNNLQFNSLISISAIIIIYEIVILSLYLLKIINKKLTQNLISWAVIINFFIIFVMFLTDCNVDIITRFSLITIKIILLVLVLSVAKLSFKNYFIGIIFLIFYFVISNINKIYNCDIKYLHIFNSLLCSTMIYFLLFFLIFSEHKNESLN